jgi:16S rRNA (uracil1498-N3)-methyltransferase
VRDVLTVQTVRGKPKAASHLMSLSRFYLPAQAWGADVLVLSGDEAAHCTRVQRHAVGDRVEVADGAGRVAEAEISAVNKNEVHLRPVTVRQHEPLTGRIHLLPALIKGEAFEWLLEKAVELGAASVQPVLTERTVVHLDAGQAAKKLSKWRRLMIESAKQCHTPFLPDLHAPLPLPEALARAPRSAVKIMPALSEHSRALGPWVAELHQEACLLIGPEGDFAPQEEDLARQAGFIPVTLGPLVLRAETAAVAALAILGHELRR